MGLISIIVTGFFGMLGIWAEHITGEKELTNDIKGKKTILIKTIFLICIALTTLFAMFDWFSSREESALQQRAYLTLDSTYKEALRAGVAIRSIDSASKDLIISIRNAKDTLVKTTNSSLNILATVDKAVERINDPLPAYYNLRVSIRSILVDSISRRLDLMVKNGQSEIDLIDLSRKHNLDWDKTYAALSFADRSDGATSIAYAGYTKNSSAIVANTKAYAADRIVYNPTTRKVGLDISIRLEFSGNESSINRKRDLDRATASVIIQNKLIDFANCEGSVQAQSPDGIFFWDYVGFSDHTNRFKLISWAEFNKPIGTHKRARKKFRNKSNQT